MKTYEMSFECCDDCPCMSALYDESAEVCKLMPREREENEFRAPFHYLKHNTYVGVDPDCPLKTRQYLLALRTKERGT